jgi:biopolymer transport protein ExbD
MSVHFKKKKAGTQQDIPTASLPDIVFMLLIFFMVTTVLREQDLLVRVQLPSAESIQKIEQKRLVSYIFIGPRADGQGEGEDAVQIDDAIVEDLTQVGEIMYRKLLEEPRMIVSFRVDSETETGMLYDVQQELRRAEILRINYSTQPETDS